MTDDIIYLAAPYSHSDKAIIHGRMGAFAGVHARLILDGALTHSPLLNHFIVKKGVPGDWVFWQRYSERMLDKSDRLLVIRMPGWDFSSGVAGEIEYAQKHDIPVDYTDAWTQDDWNAGMAEYLLEELSGFNVEANLKAVSRSPFEPDKARALIRRWQSSFASEE